MWDSLLSYSHVRLSSIFSMWDCLLFPLWDCLLSFSHVRLSFFLPCKIVFCLSVMWDCLSIFFPCEIVFCLSPMWDCLFVFLPCEMLSFSHWDRLLSFFHVRLSLVFLPGEMIAFYLFLLRDSLSFCPDFFLSPRRDCHLSSSQQ